MPPTKPRRVAVARAPAADDPTIVFPQGLVGCEAWKRFVLLRDDEHELPVGTLQSLDDPAVTLLVTDPALLVPGYAVRLTADDRALLGLAGGAAPVTYCTLSVGEDGWLTANLLGPLVVNPATRRGRQLVLVDSAYSTRYPVARLAAATGRDAACSS